MKKFADYTQEELMQEAERRIAEAYRTGAEELSLDFWREDNPQKLYRPAEERMNHASFLTMLPKSLRTLTQLKKLTLDNNLLSTLPEWLGEFSQLKELSAIACAIETLPESLGQLSQLQVLNLANNLLVSLPKAMGRLSQLQTLNLSDNQLSFFPKVISQLSQLQKLYCSRNLLVVIPKAVGRLFQLKELYLSDNQLENLPEAIGQLKQLQKLYLPDNQLKALPETLGHLSQLQELHLWNNRLVTLPEGLGQLSQLEVLNLWGNQLTALPEAISQLSHLRTLDISENYLIILPDKLGQLSQLQELNLWGNNLVALPDILGQLSQLQILDLSYNELTSLPEAMGQLSQLQGLDLDSNPLSTELAAAYEQGTSAVLTYLQASKVPLYEAKLILIGEGNVGKSCLLGALRGDPWEAGRSTTHGIEIKPVPVTDPDSGQVITMNGWDFGGQPVYRPTHQLFFSAPAVYLVVWSPRDGIQRGAVQEWIRLVKYREPSAKILVVATHRSPGQRQPDIDRQGLWDLFGRDTILDFLWVDSEHGTGIDELRDQIARIAASLPEMGRRVHKEWQAVREALQQEALPYLSRAEVVARCQQQGLSLAEAEQFVRIAHELGHLIHYHQDEVLRNVVVLKPDWLTKAISFVLDDETTRQRHGLASFAHLRTLWHHPSRPVAEQYARELHPVFLRLMERFELSYRIADDSDGRLETSTSLIAQLVPDERPATIPAWDDYHQPRQTQLCRIVELGTDQSASAEGLFYRLIVRMHRFSLGRVDYNDSVHWQRGLVLDDDYNGRAFLEHVGNDIRVSVKAVYPDNLLSRLTGDIKWLVKKYWEGLDCPVMVSCTAPCGLHTPGTGLFDVGTLMGHRARGRTVYPCPVRGCFEEQRIDQLLHNTSVPATESASLLAGIAALLAQVGTLSQDVGQLLAGQRTLADDVVARIASMVDAAFIRLLDALDDEARDGPRLFSIEAVDRTWTDWPKGLGARKFRLTLWCEHSRLPLPILNGLTDTRGVYDLELPREFFMAAVPFFKVLFGTLSAVLPVALAGAVATDLLVPKELADQVKDGLELMSKSFDGLAGWQDEQLKATGPLGEKARATAGLEKTNPALRSWAEDLNNGGPALRGQSALRTIQAYFKKTDSSSGGLVQVRNNQQKYLWVHPRYASLY